jgi:hypothetical protein
VGPTDPQSFWPSLSDVARNIGSGAVNALAGVGQFAANLGSGLPSVGPTGSPKPQAPQTVDQAAGRAYDYLGIPQYVPSTAGGKIAQGAVTGALTGGLPGAAVGGISEGGRLLGLPEWANTALGTVGGILTHKLTGSIPGVGNSAPVAGAPLTKPLLGPEEADLAAKMQGAGVRLSATDLTDSYFLKKLQDLSNKMPFSGSGALRAAQQESYNRAAADAIGISGVRRLTPDVLQANLDRIGNTLDDIGGRTTIQADQKLMDSLSDIEASAHGELSDNQFKPIRQNLDNVLAKLGNGSMSGSDYQALTRYDTPLGRAMRNSDGQVRYFASQIRGVLDDAMQRYANSKDAIALQQARSQWKMQTKVLEPSLAGADVVGGPSPSLGDVNPATLLAQVRKVYGSSAVARGQAGPLGDLAQGGQRFMKAPPSSGTAEGSAILHGIGASALGLGAEHLTGDPLMLGAGAGVLALNRWLFNPALRSRALLGHPPSRSALGCPALRLGLRCPRCCQCLRHSSRRLSSRCGRNPSAMTAFRPQIPRMPRWSGSSAGQLNRPADGSPIRGPLFPGRRVTTEDG